MKFFKDMFSFLSTKNDMIKAPLADTFVALTIPQEKIIDPVSPVIIPEETVEHYPLIDQINLMISLKDDKKSDDLKIDTLRKVSNIFDRQNYFSKHGKLNPDFPNKKTEHHVKQYCMDMLLDNYYEPFLKRCIPAVTTYKDIGNERGIGTLSYNEKLIERGSTIPGWYNNLFNLETMGIKGRYSYEILSDQRYSSESVTPEITRKAFNTILLKNQKSQDINLEEFDITVQEAKIVSIFIASTPEEMKLPDVQDVCYLLGNSKDNEQQSHLAKIFNELLVSCPEAVKQLDQKSYYNAINGVISSCKPENKGDIKNIEPLFGFIKSNETLLDVDQPINLDPLLNHHDSCISHSGQKIKVLLALKGFEGNKEQDLAAKRQTLGCSLKHS